MDLVRLSIPYWFISERTRFTWRDARFGIVNELLDPHASLALAIERLDALDEPPQALLDLAGLSKGERTLDFVECLAESETCESVLALVSFAVVRVFADSRDVR